MVDSAAWKLLQHFNSLPMARVVFGMSANSWCAFREMPNALTHLRADRDLSANSDEVIKYPGSASKRRSSCSALKTRDT